MENMIIILIITSASQEIEIYAAFPKPAFQTRER